MITVHERSENLAKAKNDFRRGAIDGVQPLEIELGGLAVDVVARDLERVAYLHLGEDRPACRIRLGDEETEVAIGNAPVLIGKVTIEQADVAADAEAVLRKLQTLAELVGKRTRVVIAGPRGVAQGHERGHYDHR